MQSVIHAEDSDLYDVLVYVAFHSNPLKRTQRAEFAKSQFDGYGSNQRVFLDFVLKQYVESGVSELDDTATGRIKTVHRGSG
jgi:type I restriction enzyme R subunit